jgi:hypothetical protein
MSLGVKAALEVTVESVPLNVTAGKETPAGDARVRLPPVQVTGLNVATTADHAPECELVIV